jgi:hypothetical protein
MPLAPFSLGRFSIVGLPYQFTPKLPSPTHSINKSNGEETLWADMLEGGLLILDLDVQSLRRQYPSDLDLIRLKGTYDPAETCTGLIEISVSANSGKQCINGNGERFPSLVAAVACLPFPLSSQTAAMSATVYHYPSPALHSDTP